MIRKNKKRILIVEDESHIAEGLKLNLTLQGYSPIIARDGGDALRRWKTERPDLIILDIMLPVIDGLSVLQHIRLEDDQIPILILSAKSAHNDKIKGLSYGVDDYLTKPFHLDELLLRIERLLKRCAWSGGCEDARDTVLDTTPTVYVFGGNTIDFRTATAQCRCGRIHLTEQELRLMKLFIAHRGKPLSRSKLLKVGWGYTGKTTTRTVDNFIVRLRKYFEENPKKPVFFKSLRAVGYVFDHD
ncbi:MULTISPECIES: response regulator transcription factor [Desulfococcus]|jgi:DNA-binding response OmpR family regulator|uniref:Two component transcriptional regulator, winged helix family n=1 Tax=Desulfococcus multivorans DSM 2059 TaxID=1121405 RepID=S7UK11_DESML|nr:response regulator transcription factor [Desulfococcus multivorans]AOY59497.1 two component response regulator [Desulfococcus multivorans]AQV01696.1 DNA-binding response regulator [Desulfococcus multivorans]EPR34144.1 two component transcriptional regulator, winged helix family [Desulfococcus multivorans DSM 2059]MDX9818183.1 response regulator transcription factor [Desulfococcus multivorans]SKA19426.1 DNA-binding response regulator, OmpR family, contains REC and winged-helix (wHTH) domain 